MSLGLLDAPELAAERIDARARGENFPVASLLAPRWARPHLRAIYGFARLVDNLGDEAEGDRGALLDELERELEGPPRTEMMRRLHATIGARSLPLEPFRRLIEANRIDQLRSRYETWGDVREYCTYSADPVGRLVLGVYGRLGEAELVAMSDSVCTGLQLVNFLQDPPRDLALGRVYLPQEDLRRFGVRDEELAGPLTDRIARLLRFEATRAGELLLRGLPLADTLGGRPGLSVALYARGGLAALEALERAGWDVFAARPAPTRWTFARLALLELLGRR
ncbi:MAG: squalene synthase HpnC [Gaiellaceae bacterium]